MHPARVFFTALTLSVSVTQAAWVNSTRSLATSPTCSLEVNVDYVGNDVANTPGQASECCTKCQQNPRCSAFTWSSHNGGTCWLKSGRTSTKASSGVTSGQVVPASGCSVESGVDYAGNDLANVVKSSAGDCCTVCSQREGCKAFTWTNYNGGTCWLKTGRGVTSANAGAISGLVESTAPPSNCDTLEQGVDYTGADVGSASAGNAASCCGKCASFSGCKAFTWTNYNGGTCWLKSVKGTSKSNSGATSGSLGSSPTPTPTPSPSPTDTPTPTPTPTPSETPTPTPSETPTPTPSPTPGSCSLETGVDYSGADLVNVPGSDAQGCCSKCGDYEDCAAFTWTNFNGGTCWLKTAKGSAKTSSGATSGTVTPSNAQCLALEPDTDYAGGDLASTIAGAPASCCAKCARFAGCTAFTWTDYNGGTCWFKSGKGSSSAKKGAVSGTVKNTATPHIQASMRTGAVPLKAVNLGSWFVGEQWQSASAPCWNGYNEGWRGEYATMKYLGHQRGDPQFEKHRQTWITEQDLLEMKNAGLNSVRIPVGYWIVNDDPSTTIKSPQSQVFAPGGLKYLDRMINDWGVKHNLAVILSLHAHQGSQNGYDHSAPENLNQISWDNPTNIDNSVQFATVLARRYKHSPAFLGLTLMNEPLKPVSYGSLYNYYSRVIDTVRNDGNDCALTIAPYIGDQGPYNPTQDWFRWPQYSNVWQEWHVYFRWGYEGLPTWRVLEEVRKYKQHHFGVWTGNYVFMGEWSLTHTDEARFQDDKNVWRQFAQEQLNTLQGAHSGWAFWTWRHEEENHQLSGWSMRQMIREGILPTPL